DPGNDFGNPIDDDTSGSADDDSIDDGSATDSEMAEMYSDSFDNEPGYDITEPVEGEATIPDPVLDSGFGSESTASSSNGEVVRYVDALLLNVRSAPTLRAPIVRRLLGGAKIRVTISNG